MKSTSLASYHEAAEPADDGPPSAEDGVTEYLRTLETMMVEIEAANAAGHTIGPVSWDHEGYESTLRATCAVCRVLRIDLYAGDGQLDPAFYETPCSPWIAP